MFRNNVRTLKYEEIKCTKKTTKDFIKKRKKADLL